MVMLACLVHAVARSDRDDRARRTYRILYNAQEVTDKVSFVSNGR